MTNPWPEQINAAIPKNDVPHKVMLAQHFEMTSNAYDLNKI